MTAGSIVLALPAWLEQDSLAGATWQAWVALGYLIVFGTALHSDAGTFDVWLTRLGYFFLAGLFTIGMMALIWPRSPNLGPNPGSNLETSK